MPLPDGVTCVLAPNPSLMTGPGTNTYVIAGAIGPCAVIDPGSDAPGHLDAIVRAAGSRGIGHILSTHAHPDHAGGAAPLRALTGAPVLAWSREGVPDADRTLVDDERVVIGDRTLRALYTPGHRFDHLCFLLEDSGALFAGDLVAGVGTVVIAPPEGDMRDYLASLNRLLTLQDLQMILPAHGPSITDGPALLRSYLAHRLEREQQVLGGLRNGPTTVATLVVQIYADVDPALHPAAARSVLAHLLKLEREGRVARAPEAQDGEAWALVPSAQP